MMADDGASSSCSADLDGFSDDVELPGEAAAESGPTTSTADYAGTADDGTDDAAATADNDGTDDAASLHALHEEVLFTIVIYCTGFGCGIGSFELSILVLVS